MRKLDRMVAAVERARDDFDRFTGTPQAQTAWRELERALSDYNQARMGTPGVGRAALLHIK